MFNPQVLANNIKTYRKMRGMAQNALAAALSVSPQAVSKWECGVSVPDLENLCAIAQLLEVSLDVLLGNTGSNKKLMIGVDGGGTKTEFLMFTEEGMIIERLVLGTCNPNSIGIPACVEMLVKGINTLLTLNPDVCGIYIGSAGFILGNNAPDIRVALKKHYPGIKIECVTDILNVVASATDADNCIAAICGTGASVLVKEGEKLTRLTGWGYLLSKAGSGYDIGRDAICAVMADLDGLDKHTLLTDLVKTKIGETVSDIVDKIYKGNQAYIASCSRLVFEAFRAGDEVAGRILLNNARGLAETINHAYNHYNCGNKLILAGGIVTNNPDFVDILRKQLNPALKVIIPAYPQVFGACVMCARMCHVNTDRLLEKLAQQYERRCNIC